MYYTFLCGSPKCYLNYIRTFFMFCYRLKKKEIYRKNLLRIWTLKFFFRQPHYNFCHYCSEGSEILSWNVKKSWKSCKWKIWIYEIFLMIIIVSLCLIGKKIFICNTRTVGFLVLSAGGKSRIVLCHLWIIFALI